MKGFILKFKDLIYNVGVPNCGSTVTINIVQSNAFFNAGSLKMPEEIHFEWPGGELEIGDEIEVEMAEFDVATEPLETESHKELIAEMTNRAEDDSYIWARKLKRFHRIESILKEEGLL